MVKIYKEPKFVFIEMIESNKVFFASSGTPSAPAMGGSLGSMTQTTGTW